MSLTAKYTFNENDTANVYDYSGNGNNSVSVTALSIGNGELGKLGRFDGATSVINYGDICDYGGTNTMSIFAKINLTTSQKNVLAFKSAGYDLRINVSDQVVFTIYIGSAAQTLTTAETISTATYQTIAAVYDGVKMYIYIDGVESISAAQTGNLDASSNDLLIGSDGSFFYDGNIETIEFRSDALSAAGVTSLDNSPTGIQYKTRADNGLSLGDLISYDQYGTEIKMTVSYIVDTKEYYAVPVSGKMNIGMIPIRRGNIGVDTSRQWRGELVIDSGSPKLVIYDGINTFATPGSSNKRSEISNNTIAQDNIDLLKLSLLGN